MATSTDNVADFIANEAMRRYGFPEGPIHLLDWDPDALNDGHETNSFADFGLFSLRSPVYSNRKERRSSLIRLFCNRFTEIIENQGREELSLLQRTLQKRLEREKDHLNRFSNLESYRELLLEQMCDPCIEQGNNKIEWETGPYHEAVWPCPEPPEGFTLDFYDIGGRTLGLQVHVSDELLEENGIDADMLPPRPTKLIAVCNKQGPWTYSLISRVIKERFAPHVRARRASEEIHDLLRFRSALLKQYMWAYDIYGVPPNLADTVFVPEDIRSRPVRVEHTVTALHVLEQCRQEGVTVNSQADLTREIEDRTTAQERKVSAEAVVKGAKRLIGDLPGTKTEGAGLLESLSNSRERVLLYADEMGIHESD